jgi:hypothetical protein
LLADAAGDTPVAREKRSLVQMSEDNRDEIAELDTDAILELNFVPEWARKPPSSSHFGFPDARDEERRRERRPVRERDERRDRDTGRRPGPRGREERGPSRREAERGGRPREDGRREMPAPERPDRRGRHAGRGRPDAPPLPPVEVSFFPDRRQLAALVRQVHASRKAYPLLDIASLLMGKPEFCHVKIESRRGDDGVDICLCSICRTAALDRSLIVSHAFRDHTDEFFTVEVTELPEPTGQFNCVARCGLSGVLLGPPNHHSYAERVQEVHASRFAHLPMDEYRRRIETVRDDSLVEQWKSEVRKQQLYRPKAPEAPGVQPMPRYKAEQYFRDRLAESVVTVTRRAVLPATTAQKIEDRDLMAAVRAAWQREQRFPRSVLFALRAALRHMNLHIFRAGRGINFVTHTQPSPLDPKYAVEAIAEVLVYLRKHPGSTREDMVAALRPGEEDKTDGAKDILSPLGWLIEKGHIIEFFNGTLSVPLEGSRGAQAQTEQSDDSAAAEPSAPSEQSPA